MLYGLVFVALVILLLVALLLWKQRSHQPREPTVDVVIARYEEDLDWIQRLDMTPFRWIIIYNKGRSLTKPLPANGKIRVVSLPNVGRCDHTYMYHIVNNYDRLATNTIFVPASCAMEYKWKNAMKTIGLTLSTKDSVFVGDLYNDVAKDLGDFKLDEWKASNGQNVSLNPETKLLPCPERPFGVWFKNNFGDIHIRGVVFYGIFSVHRDHIHNRTLDFYKQLIRYLDHHSNPEAGHYFERAWLAIFNPVPLSCVYPSAR